MNVGQRLTAPAAGPIRQKSSRTRSTALVQSPLRAGILRFLCARPEETFDVEALMQTFGRMRLDVENCVRELVDFGIAKKVTPAGGAAALRVHPAATATSVHDLLDEFLERRATVSSEDRSPAGPALPRDDRPRREDARHLRVDPDRRQVRHLGADPRADRIRQGSRGAHDPRAVAAAARTAFQAVNCAALPDTLFESEIFGYEKGAFTGAHDRKPGRLELANNGTLFLDEIGDMSLMAQAKLLRVLEERRFERLGGNASIEVNFRLISATNRPLDQFVRDTRFREDLYYRVNAFSIRLPSLRERATDIPVLAQRFLARYCAANGLPLDGKAFSQGSDRSRCCSITGPATSASSRAPCRARRSRRPGATIRPQRHRVPARRRDAGRTRRGERLPSLADAERAHIIRVLESVGWNKKQAAAVLEISRGTLYRKIVEYRPRGNAIQRLETEHKWLSSNLNSDTRRVAGTRTT